MHCALSVLWGKSDMTYQLRLCCAAWCLWVHTQCSQPAWPLSAGLIFSTKVQTKSLNHFAVWSSDTVEDEKEGNGRWWEKEWEPGCPSVFLIHAYTLFPSGLLQWFIYHISPESCISWVYLCWISHRAVMNMTIFFSLTLSQSMEGARKKHLQAWSCCIESQNECQRADWAWRKTWCPLIPFDSSVRHAHFWVTHLNTFLLCETHRWVSVASVLRQPQWSEVRWLGNPEASWHTGTEVPSAFQKSIRSGQKELKVVKTF